MPKNPSQREGGRPKGARNKNSNKASRRITEELAKNPGCIGRFGVKAGRKRTKPKEENRAERLRVLEECEAGLLKGPSKIHAGGDGVFAHRQLIEGEWVARHMGEEITKRVYAERKAAANLLPSKPMCYWIKGFNGQIIDGSDPELQTVASFVNHSCQPNCAAVKVRLYRKHYTALVTLTDIPEGDELSYNYLDVKDPEERECVCTCSLCLQKPKADRCRL